MSKEIWKDISGYEGLYQVSNHGRVKSLKRDGTHRNQFSTTENILKQQKHKNGYLCSGLYDGNHKCKIFSVHRLVAQAFIDNPENLSQVNHKDGDKSNNCVSNLEWCSCSHNIKHAYDNGIKPKKYGGDHHNARKVNQFDLQGNYIKTWESIIEVERATGISAVCISQVCKRALGTSKHKNRYKTSGGYLWEYA